MNTGLGQDGATGDCVLVPGTPWGSASITVGLTEDLDPAHAPGPTTDSERFLFAHLFETLVTVDCRGTVRPGLAATWESGEGGRVWTFTLREGARFSDGTRISGEHVRRAWAAARVSTPGPWLWVHPDSVQALDETRLRIAFSEGSDRFPAVFADPGLSVVKRESAKGWPVGSGPYLISLDRGEEIRCLPNPYHPETGATSSPLRFVVRPGMDSRDLLGDDIDVLLVRDKVAVEYAANLSEYAVYPVAWDRTYFLLSRYDWDEELGEPYLDQVKRELAEEVVLALARPVDRIGFPDHAPDWSIKLHSPPGPGNIVFSEGDKDAARITERLVALTMESAENDRVALFGRGLEAAALGMPQDVFERSLMTGNEWGYVISLPRMLPDLRDDLELGFMSLGFLDPRVPGTVFGVDCVPLLSTRSHLVIRRGLVGLVEGGGGAVYLQRAGWEKGSALP